jgi:hypothetical protein
VNRTATGIDAEDVALLCLLEADGELAIPAADLADLIDATERRAKASFGPAPGLLRQAFAGLALEAALATPGELYEGGLDAALARVNLWDLLGPMLSRDRLWFTAGGVHWDLAAPGSFGVSEGARRRSETLMMLAASRPPPMVVLAVLERLGVDRSFIGNLLDRAREAEEAVDLRRQVSYQDWYE